jgi:dsRNA-specific ribonuclease
MYRGLPTIISMLEALMPKSCLQHMSYERLEIIGDAFLKFDASLHCYRAFPLSHEGAPSCLIQ